MEEMSYVLAKNLVAGVPAHLYFFHFRSLSRKISRRYILNYCFQLQLRKVVSTYFAYY